MRVKTEITTGVRLVVQRRLPNSPRFIRNITHKLKQIRLVLMTCIDSELLCVLLFKCAIFRSTRTRGNFPLWSPPHFSRPWLLWLSWKMPRKSSHVLMMEMGELWSYGALVMGVIKTDSNVLVWGSYGPFSVPRWSSSMQRLLAPDAGGMIWSVAAASMSWI